MRSVVVFGALDYRFLAEFLHTSSAGILNFVANFV